MIAQTVWWSGVGSGRWWPNGGGPAGAEICEGLFRPLANGRRRNVVRPPHTTHDPHATKICYRFHPFYGVDVEVIRCLRKSESVILIVKVPAGSQIAVPEWMLIPQVCDRLTIEDQARISIDALINLRRLIDSQCLNRSLQAPGRAESPAGGQDGQEPKSNRLATPSLL